MIRYNNIKLPVDGSIDIKSFVASRFRVPEDEIAEIAVRKRSLDARKRDAAHFVINADITLREKSSEKTVMKKRSKSLGLTLSERVPYKFPYNASQSPVNASNGSECTDIGVRPVIIGMGPAGLFCAYELALAGFKPLLIERGAPVDERVADIDRFWTGDKLNRESNVCFGEGGAGAFSDGKLNSSSSDASMRNHHVLETFVKFGADEDILSWYRPHVGTDVLKPVLKSMREALIAAGGEVRFHTRVDDFITNDSGSLSALRITDTKTGDTNTISCKIAVLAIGHSASDTIGRLNELGVQLEQKAFAVGFRVQHPQSLITESQYGPSAKYLPTADYKLTSKTSGGRGVYSFCMCPGGYVVNSSSEDGQMVVNGMSYHDRAGENANSAIVITVTPKDFMDDHPLAGFEFQKKMEQAAYRSTGGRIPAQRLGQFAESVGYTGYTFGNSNPSVCDMGPQFKGGYEYTDLKGILPHDLEHVFLEGMTDFDRKIPGFGHRDVILAGVESRTSSPVRITRNEEGECTIKGLYPCGEGAGYAGGIMSAAIDGITVAEKVAKRIMNK